MINGITLKVDLIAIEMKDFDVILGIDFLGRNIAIINCCHRTVTFNQNNGEKFAFKGRLLLNHKMIMTSKCWPTDVWASWLWMWIKTNRSYIRRKDQL